MRAASDMGQFLSTSPARGTTTAAGGKPRPTVISIHIPREGDDLGELTAMDKSEVISIHIPREGDDGWLDCHDRGGQISIHIPREGDDVAFYVIGGVTKYFYPHPPRGGRPQSSTLR